MTGSPDQERAEAFNRFVVPEMEMLFRVALAFTREQAEAEDLVQDTLIRAYRGIDGFNGDFPRAWLLTILRNTNMSRHRRRRPGLLADPDAIEDRSGSTVGSDPELRAMNAVLDDAVETAFAALPVDQRTVICLVDMDGLSYEEAADLLGVPVGTVMSRLHRGRKRIKRRLAGSGLDKVRRFRTWNETHIGCMAVARMLQAYIDGEVDEATARRVGAHLEVCRRCGMKADTFRAIKASLVRGGGWDDLTRRRLEEFARRVGHDRPAGI